MDLFTVNIKSVFLIYYWIYLKKLPGSKLFYHPCAGWMN